MTTIKNKDYQLMKMASEAIYNGDYQQARKLTKQLVAVLLKYPKWDFRYLVGEDFQSDMKYGRVDTDKELDNWFAIYSADLERYYEK